MELIHTCYRIGDIDRSVEFYEALGFEERRRMPIRDEAINVFMGVPGRRRPARADVQPRRRLLRAGHGLQPHRADGRRPRRHARRARRQGHRAREAAVPGARGREPDLLRARSRRLPHRAHRARLTRVVGPFRFAAPEAREDSADLLFMPEATAADWAKVFAHAEPMRVSAGLAVLQAGEEDRGLYLITEGTLGVRLPRGETRLQGDRGAGGRRRARVLRRPAALGDARGADRRRGGPPGPGGVRPARRGGARAGADAAARPRARSWRCGCGWPAT